MKKISLYIACLFLLYSCSKDNSTDAPKEEKEPEVEIENTAPSAPELSYPTNNLVCISNVINFQWNAATDAENNSISYLLEIATDTNFTQDLKSSNISVITKEITLIKGQSYYWRVKATDSENASSEYSDVYNFYTEGDGSVNYLPFAPELIAPELNSAQTTNTIDLKWNAEDADGDDLTYDVYFGETNPPTEVVAADITTNTINVDIPNTNNYYWKIVVNDGKGGTTIGAVWEFTKE